MRYTIEVYRLPARDNKPHKWHWAVQQWDTGTQFQAGRNIVKGAGQANSKKEALQFIQETLESLKSE